MSVRRSLAWALSGQAATFLVSFAGSILLARILSPHEMGIYAVAVATMGVVSILGTMGISSYIIRDVELSPARLASAFTVNLLLNCLIAAILFAISFSAARFMREAGVALILRVLAVVPLIQSLEFLPAAMLQREMRFRAVATITSLTALLTSTVQVTLAYLGYSYMGIGYATVTAALFSALANNVVGRRYASLRMSLDDWRGISAFGFRMLTISGVAVLTQRVADIILGRALGLSALGLYSRASNISNLIFFNLYGSATRFMFAKMSSDYRETGRVTKTFLGGLEMILCVMWPILAGMAILSKPTIVLLYGAKWLGTAPVLSWLMVAQMVALCFGMNWELFVIHDEIKRQTRFEAIRSVTGIVTFAIGCQFGIAAAALGRVVEACFGLALYLPHMGRLAQTPNERLVALYARSFALTVAAVLPALALMVWSGWDANVSRPLLFGSVAAGIMAWLAALRFLDHPMLDEMRRLVYRLVPAAAPAMRRP